MWHPLQLCYFLGEFRSVDQPGHEVRYEYERTGVTIGENKFLYRAHIYRGHTHLKQVSGFVRLFDAIWDNPQCEVYR